MRLCMTANAMDTSESQFQVECYGDGDEEKNQQRAGCVVR